MSWNKWSISVLSQEQKALANDFYQRIKSAEYPVPGSYYLDQNGNMKRISHVFYGNEVWVTGNHHAPFIIKKSRIGSVVAVCTNDITPTSVDLLNGKIVTWCYALFEFQGEHRVSKIDMLVPVWVNSSEACHE